MTNPNRRKSIVDFQGPKNVGLLGLQNLIFESQSLTFLRPKTRKKKTRIARIAKSRLGLPKVGFCKNSLSNSIIAKLQDCKNRPSKSSIATIDSRKSMIAIRAIQVDRVLGCLTIFCVRAPSPFKTREPPETISSCREASGPTIATPRRSPKHCKWLERTKVVA